MPTVPIEQNRVGIADVTDAKLQAPDRSGTGLQALGRGMQTLGQAGGDYAGTVHDVGMRFIDATAKDADNQSQQAFASLGFDGPDAFFNKGGKDALLAQPGFVTALATKNKEIRAGLKDPIAQTLFDRALAQRQAEQTRQIGAHVDRETNRYESGQSEGLISLSLNAAATAAATNHPGALDDSERRLDTARAELVHFGQINHWSPEQTQAAVATKISAARHDILVTLNNSGSEGPRTAQAYLDRFRGDFTADDASSGQSHIRSMENAQAAEQRRAAAELRHQETEDRRAAGERAADTARVIQTGTPVPPDQVANAISDAQKANRPALVAEIKNGAFKNNLNVQFRDSTPAQIQDELNAVNARIAKAGQRVSENDQIESDHLTTLLSKSSDELRADPISWGAKHLGIAVPPLDINKPETISQRVAAARNVSARTGAPIRMMTNEEAAGLTAAVATGSTAQRQQVVTNLARFGSYAPLAAAQIAPGNDSFVNLVGLAGGKDPAANSQHVHWVLAGQEILKAKPQLVKRAEAEANFNTGTGGAFELLLSVRNGALENAIAMSASLSDTRGVVDWNSGGSENFNLAINDSVGGYMDHGVRRGGINTFNGRKTLMPDGMSGAEFETALAKAPAPKWQQAWNGPPVAANGEAFTYGHLRQMQFVAVGDGRYRLTDGAQYVGKKGGGFFEVDVRKLR